MKAGFHDFYISTHYKAEMVTEYIGDGRKWGVKVEYIYEHEPLGTAGALGLLPDTLSKLPVVMTNGDLLVEMNFENLIKFHGLHNGIATVGVKEYDIQVPYGVIHGDNDRVKCIEEKPVQHFFINAGIYVLDNAVLAEVKGDKYLDMPALLEQLIKKDKKVNMFPIHEYWLDIGRLEQYEKAQKDVAGI